MREQNEKEEAKTATLDMLLIVIMIAIVFPFLVMFVWNTLVNGMFGLATIGYGGAWAVMLIRSFFFKTTPPMPKNQTPDESLKRTLKSYVKSALIAAATLIIAWSLGYL